MPDVQCCGRSTALVGGERIYPHRPDLSGLKFYLCEKCGAYTGCHKGTDKPKGTPANKELREARMRAHAAFDPIWRYGKMSRREAYKWLAEAVGFDGKLHIGFSGVEMCNRIVEACQEKRNA